MTDDERAIRDLVAQWMEASRRGDIDTVLRLMTEDAVFTVPGGEPFGREAFKAAAGAANTPQVDGRNEIVELQVSGDWAFTRNHLELSMTMADGKTIRRGGYTLTLYRKESDGRWRLMRDANLLTSKS